MNQDPTKVPQALDVIDPMENVVAQTEMITPQLQVDQATKNLAANFSPAAIAQGEKKYGTSKQRDFAAVPQNNQVTA
jgi:hypothetical protein